MTALEGWQCVALDREYARGDFRVVRSSDRGYWRVERGGVAMLHPSGRPRRFRSVTRALNAAHAWQLALEYRGRHRVP